MMQLTSLSLKQDAETIIRKYGKMLNQCYASRRSRRVGGAIQIPMQIVQTEKFQWL
jgi:hypothetical protein